MSRPKVHPRVQAVLSVVSWDAFPVGLATIALGLVETGNIPEGPLRDFVGSHGGWVVLVCILLMILPPGVTKVIERRRAINQAVKRKSEVANAVGGIQQRISHLIAKHREVSAGERTNSYIAHTLSDCGGYFKNRRTLGGEAVGTAEPVVEVVFYRRKRPKNGATSLPNVFECVKFTSDDANMFATTLSMRGADNAKSVVNQALSGEIFYSSSLGDDDRVSAVVQGPRRPEFSAACMVPVLADRDTPAPDGVLGIMVVVSNDAKALVKSDKKICNAYAWCIAAAEAMDKTVRTPHTVVRSPEFQARTQLS